ncbi:Lanosterol 14-alpha-demethylase [Neonectria magnoliae]|uniref:Lanosterol 14-alpha-demethylase n=1 Tax=Neonectria magnoliae TaxID=2732573 RepID=A0ABR1HXU7_9HYPO
MDKIRDYVLYFPLYAIGGFLALILCNVLQQRLFRRSGDAPLVLHWFPFIGNAVSYGLDPYSFFLECRKKHGDVFTFVLFGRKITCCLGIQGNDFVLNSRHQDANAEEIYGPLTTPVFGSDVVYDCPNWKLMEQKKFVKFGLTQKALESHVQKIEGEVLDYINSVSTLTHAKMRAIYMDIINDRRKSGVDVNEGSDMICNLMRCSYKNGQPVPDKEVAHMMITLLMAGQHTSSSASSWIILHLASRPDMPEELYREQLDNLSVDGVLPPLQYSDLDKLPILQNVVKETLRVHSSIHSILRKVKNPLHVPRTPYIVAPGKVIFASPIVTALSDEYFTNAKTWNPHRWDNKPREETAGDE